MIADREQGAIDALDALALVMRTNRANTISTLGAAGLSAKATSTLAQLERDADLLQEIARDMEGGRSVDELMNLAKAHAAKIAA